MKRLAVPCLVAVVMAITSIAVFNYKPGTNLVAPAPSLSAGKPSTAEASAVEIAGAKIKTEIAPAATPPTAQRQKIAGKNPKSAKQKDPIQDPDARAALSLVGADSDAEQYWTAAINNPNLPANERKDLIEDLNEDGLSDPKHPGAQDLALILNRLRLIEELTPLAMDPVNADAFQEAYKDLANLAAGGLAQ